MSASRMTEQDWLACGDIQAMLFELGYRGLITKKEGGHRRLRLFAVACCRRIWELLSEEGRLAVQTAEEQAERRQPDRGLLKRLGEALLSAETNVLARFIREPAASAAAFTAMDLPWDAAGRGPRNAAIAAAIHATGGTWPTLDYPAVVAAQAEEERRQADLLRDIFGNPFRPRPTVAASVLSWGDGTVRRLARAIYDERAFDRMPILGDALEEAGSADGAILGHCRGTERHARGCWLLDCILQRPTARRQSV
jgi:hypothetical protein